jgi:CubicO group peptidase (beta-lactamase class C family)
MTCVHRVVAAVLACGALACNGTNSTSTTGPAGGVSLSGVWNANVLVSSSVTHNTCTLTGTLPIVQTGTRITGDFSGVELCTGPANGIATDSRDTVYGPISGGQVNGQQISFLDGLGLTYVGTLDTGDIPARASGTAAGMLPMGGGQIVMSGTWSLTRPSNGVDTALVDLAFDNASQQPNMTSLVVARNGVIEKQAYFNGGGADVPKEVRSITKSVMSLLVGIAVDKGQISSLDQTLGQLLGSLGPSNPTMSAITVRQLLTMTSGFGGNELASPELYNLWAAAPDQLTYLWDHPLVATPGTQFNYYTPNYYVLSRIVTRASGQSTYAFATSSLFTPLGITGSRTWQTDDSGYYNGGVGLWLSPKDMVAIGNMVLTNGLAGTNQVVSSSWIQNATDSKVATTALGPISYETAYGYGWWRGKRNGIDYIFASGMGGQFIIVVPAKHLVVTAAANWQGVTNLNAQWQTILDNIMLRIVPAY